MKQRTKEDQGTASSTANLMPHESSWHSTARDALILHRKGGGGGERKRKEEEGGNGKRKKFKSTKPLGNEGKGRSDCESVEDRVTVWWRWWRRGGGLRPGWWKEDNHSKS